MFLSHGSPSLFYSISHVPLFQNCRAEPQSKLRHSGPHSECSVPKRYQIDDIARVTIKAIIYPSLRTCVRPQKGRGIYRAVHL